MLKFIPTVKSIETTSGRSYSSCRAKVCLEYPSVEGTAEIIVEYPMQGEKHMTMLLEDVSGKKLDHPSRMIIAGAIKEVVKD